MDPARRKLIEKFFRRAHITVMVDRSPAVEVTFQKDTFVIDVKNPLAVMGLGLDLDLLKNNKRGKSVIRKAIKDMGFKLKLRYKFFEIDL